MTRGMRLVLVSAFLAFASPAIASAQQPRPASHLPRPAATQWKSFQHADLQVRDSSATSAAAAASRQLPTEQITIALVAIILIVLIVRTAS